MAAAVHTYAEWYDARNRDLGLRRVLLLLLALAELTSARRSGVENLNLNPED